jgi:hypothetical protein
MINNEENFLMPMSLPIDAGTYLRKIFDGARWAGDGNGALRPSLAAEIEATLRFYDQQGRFERRLARLRGNYRELLAELAEPRAGRFLHEEGFQILEWEPPSSTGYPGDLLVQFEGSAAIFAEVKAPDWEGELTPEERAAGRKQQGKFLHAEARAVGLALGPLQVIRNNALKKFSVDRPNLVVVVDNLFASPADARGVMEWQIDEFFQDARTQYLGGILFLLVDCPAGRAVRYISNFYENAAAVSNCRIPEPAVRVLLARAERDAAIMSREWVAG